MDKIWIQTPKMTISAVILTLAPALLWLGAISARPIVIKPHCLAHPQSCTKESVLPIDRLSIGMEDWKADEYSYFTQNLSGTLALVVPAAWSVGLYSLGYLNPITTLTVLGADLITVLQTVSWNGLFTEISHLISQRPRPFVYQDPAQRGIDPAHYTSFYSGHTSFAAAANLATFLILFRHNAPLPILILYAALGEALIFLTAYFRILAGRHFLTDVVMGALAGLFIAWIIAFCRKNRREKMAPTLLEKP